MNYLIVPGLNNSGPKHWQSFWAKSLPNAVRVEQRSWDKPQKEGDTRQGHQQPHRRHDHRIAQPGGRHDRPVACEKICRKERTRTHQGSFPGFAERCGQHRSHPFIRADAARKVAGAGRRGGKRQRRIRLDRALGIFRRRMGRTPVQGGRAWAHQFRF